jgi:hypothetical protein
MDYMALNPRRQNSSERMTVFISSLPGVRRGLWAMKMREQKKEREKQETENIQEN